MDAGSPKLRPRRQCNSKEAERPKEKTQRPSTSTKTTREKLPATVITKKAKNKRTDEVSEAEDNKPEVKSTPDKLPITGITKNAKNKKTNEAVEAVKGIPEVKLPSTGIAKKAKNKKTTEVVETEEDKPEVRLASTGITKKAKKKKTNEVIDAVDNNPEVKSMPEKLPSSGVSESKRIPVYKQVVAVPSFVEDLDNDVYEIRTQDLSPKKKVIRKRQPKRKANPDHEPRKKIKLSPSKKKVVVKKVQSKLTSKNPSLKNVSEVLDFGSDDNFQPQFDQVEIPEERKTQVTASHKNSGENEPNVLSKPAIPLVGSSDDNRRKVYSTPLIPRRISSKVLEAGKVSTPRFAQIDESNKQSVSDEKRKCFGFDDESENEEDNNVANVSSAFNTDANLLNISPVQRPSNLPRQEFATPQSGNSSSPMSSKPQRFNWSISKPLVIQTAPKSPVLVNPVKAPLSEVKEQAINVQIRQVEKSSSSDVIEPSKQSVEGAIKRSFTSIKSKENKETGDENSVPSITVETNVELKKVEKSNDKIAKKEKVVKKSTQPLISGFLKKEIGKKQESKKSGSESEEAFTKEQKSPDICLGKKKQRSAKTYERRSFIRSGTEAANMSDNETDPEDPEASHWQQLQTSHFSEIEEMSLEFK